MLLAVNPKRARGVSVWKVIGVLAILMVLVCAGVGTFIYMNFKGWAVDLASAMVVSIVEESNLPEDQKESILTNVETLAEDVRNGDLPMEDFGEIMMSLSQGPFLNLVLVELIEADYVSKCQPNDKDRAAAALAFDRFERGIVEEKISDEKVEEAMALVQAADMKDTPQLKENLTADELKAFVEKIAQLADEEEIPAEPFTVDFAGMFQEAIDAVRGGAASTAPAG